MLSTRLPTYSPVFAVYLIILGGCLVRLKCGVGTSWHGTARTATLQSGGESVAKLTHWFKEHGGMADKVVIKIRRLRGSGAMRGAFAAAPIRSGEKIIFVPKKLILTREVIRSNEMGSALESKALNLTTDEIMTLFLCRCHSHKTQSACSHFGAYVELLAGTRAPTVDTFVRPNFDSIAGANKSYLHSAILALQHHIVELRERLSIISLRAPTLSALRADDFSLERLAHFESHYRSRHWMFQLPDSDPSTPLLEEFMLPMVDMLNYGPEGATSLHVVPGGLELRANRAFARDEELTFWYGNHCVDDALIRYGFAVDSMLPCGSDRQV